MQEKKNSVILKELLWYLSLLLAFFLLAMYVRASFEIPSFPEEITPLFSEMKQKLVQYLIQDSNHLCALLHGFNAVKK